MAEVGKVFRMGRLWYVRVGGLSWQTFLTRREAREFRRRELAR